MIGIYTWVCGTLPYLHCVCVHAHTCREGWYNPSLWCESCCPLASECNLPDDKDLQKGSWVYAKMVAGNNGPPTESEQQKCDTACLCKEGYLISWPFSQMCCLADFLIGSTKFLRWSGLERHIFSFLSTAFSYPNPLLGIEQHLWCLTWNTLTIHLHLLATFGSGLKRFS